MDHIMPGRWLPDEAGSGSDPRHVFDPAAHDAREVGADFFAFALLFLLVDVIDDGHGDLRPRRWFAEHP